jgi:hypothetical protein
MATLGRHSDSEPGMLTWIPRIILIYVGLVLVIGGLTLGWILMGSTFSAPRERPPVVSIPTGPPPTVTPTRNDVSRSTEDDTELIANAKRIKPLEDIDRGDRVIFRGQVCTWQLWTRTINTSTIKCPGRSRFQTQTARLTPVELRPDADRLGR